MKRVALLSMIISVFVWSSTMIDKFGQKVNTSFEQQVVSAKNMRLPYKPEYNPQLSIKKLTDLVKAKPDYYRGYYNLGMTYQQVKDYKKSEESFDKALEIRKKQGLTDTSIFNSAGWSAMKAQNYARAEALFLQGLPLKNKNTRAENAALFSNIGLLYFYTQRFKKALKYLTVAKDKYGSKSSGKTIIDIKEIIKSMKKD